jgi:hypothetical protein
MLGRRLRRFDLLYLGELSLVDFLLSYWVRSSRPSLRGFEKGLPFPAATTTVTPAFHRARTAAFVASLFGEPRDRFATERASLLFVRAFWATAGRLAHATRLEGMRNGWILHTPLQTTDCV